ncbi:MAG: hypothetical protein HQL33_11740 [Alphaproteobacteria bacterium]|nr:hypothetical protein [Alphaproteobacteria bacterium]
MRPLSILTVLMAAAGAAAFAYLGIVFQEQLFQTWRLGLVAALPLAFTTAALVSLRLSPLVRLNFVATVLLSVGVVYVFELGLQLGWFAAPARYGFGQGDGTFDKRSVGQVVAEGRAQGKPLFPSVFPFSLFSYRPDGTTGSALGDLLPLGGVSGVTTVSCNETGSFLIYESDAHGFHNPKGSWDGRPVDLMAVGDSFTQGHCVASDRNFVARIRARHPRTVSVGMAGNGPLLMLASLREYLPLLKPKVVLWFYYEENDISDDLPVESTAPVLTRYLAEPGFTQNLGARQEEIDTRIGAWLDRLGTEAPSAVNPPPRLGTFGSLVLSDLLLLRSTRNILNVQFKPDAAFVRLFDDILARAKAEVEARGGRLVFVNLPGKRRFANAIGAWFQDIRRERVFVLLKRQGIPVIDTVPVFSAHPDPQSLFHFHYTEDGNERVASAVLSRLEDYLDFSR